MRMKKFVVLVIAFVILCCGSAISENAATPTDLIEDYIEIDDEDFGQINPSLLHRQVFLQWMKEPSHLGEELTLVAILIDFLPTDIYTFSWEYSLDCETWFSIDEHKQTYTFILDNTNIHYYWRVKVTLEEG
jgi:hypothetical protein